MERPFVPVGRDWAPSAGRDSIQAARCQLSNICGVAWVNLLCSSLYPALAMFPYIRMTLLKALPSASSSPSAVAHIRSLVHTRSFWLSVSLNYNSSSLHSWIYLFLGLSFCLFRGLKKHGTSIAAVAMLA